MSEEPFWIERAKDTHKFHRSKLISNDKWTITKTAKSLRRSLGSVSEDLLICRWLKTHSNELERFKTAREARAFIHKKKIELEMGDIE